jgi:hypothetical protein
MSDIETAVRELIAEWDVAPRAADWDEVLRRADEPVVRTRARRRPMFVAALVACALVLAVPGLGVGDRLVALVTGGKRPGLALGAALVRGDGTRVGSVTLRTGRLFVTPNGQSRPFMQRGPRNQLRWTLTLSTRATSAVIESRTSGKRIASLCAPCAVGTASGRVRLPRGGFNALFGRADVVAHTTQGDARGRVRLQRPPRR